MKKRWFWWLGLYMVIAYAIIAPYTWLVDIPLRINEDAVAGIGYAVGNLSVLVIGILLMKKGRAKVNLAERVEDTSNG